MIYNIMTLSLLGLFLAACLIGIIIAYAPIIKKYRLLQKKHSVTNEAALNIIKEGGEAKTVATAFVSLILNSYVLIHFLINEGNKYDDKTQTKMFCSSLTPDVVAELNSLEGKYE